MSRKQRDNPSRAQILQRHKFVTIGAVEAMKSRLSQLLNDKMLPEGEFKQNLLTAHYYIYKASKQVRNITMKES